MHFSPACALFTDCTACPLREGTSRARPCTRDSPNVLTPDPFSDAVVVQSTCRRRGVYSRHVRQLDDSDHRQGAKRRAPITAQQAVLFCRSLDELGQKGNGNFTAATVRKMLSKGKAELKAAGLQEAADRVEHRRLTEEAAVLAARRARGGSPRVRGLRIRRPHCAHVGGRPAGVGRGAVRRGI